MKCIDYKITKESKRKAWRLMSITILVYIVSSVWSLFYPFRWFVFGALTIGLISFWLGPGVYLYYEYKKINRNCILSLDLLHKRLVYKGGNGGLTNANFEEIDKIQVYIPSNNYRKTITFTAMEEYSYARFDLKNGKEFYVTCLMIPDLGIRDFVEENFDKEQIVFHRWWFFPSIKLCNLFRKKRDVWSFR